MVKNRITTRYWRWRLFANEAETEDEANILRTTKDAWMTGYPRFRVPLFRDLSRVAFANQGDGVSRLGLRLHYRDQTSGANASEHDTDGGAVVSACAEFITMFEFTDCTQLSPHCISKFSILDTYLRHVG
jgi:hypothetical protein